MFRSYIKLAIRNIFKNKLIAFFNIFGLSLAIGSTLVIFIFIEFEYNVDSFHKNNKRIFLLTQTSAEDNRIYGKAPSLLGPSLKKELPAIEQVVRLQHEAVIVRRESNDAFPETLTFSDPGFFTVFDFSLKSGNARSLEDPSRVIISQDIARKYFGNEDAVGKPLKINLGGQQEIEVTVGGVAEEFPAKRSFDFDILISYDVIRRIRPDVGQWNALADATFVEMGSPADAKALASALKNYLPVYNDIVNKERILNKGLSPALEFGVQPLSTLALRSYLIRDCVSRGYGPPSGKIAFSIIGVLMLTLACLNYINTATAVGLTRLKEIGIRKVMGSSRKGLIYQFLLENLVLNFFALVVGVFLAWLILLPGFEGLFRIGLRFEFGNATLWVFLLSILLISSLLSGAYPAFYISKFNPVAILKGGKQLGTRSYLSRILIGFQFFLSFIYLVAGLLFVANEHYQRRQDWGYDRGNLLGMALSEKAAYAYFRKELPRNPDILGIAAAQEHVGYSRSDLVITIKDNAYKALQFRVDSAYLETLKFRLVKGSLLSHAGDRQYVVINEIMARALGGDSAINQTLTIDSGIYYVGGIVKDFRYDFFRNNTEPVLFRLAPTTDYNFLLMRVREGSQARVMEELKNMNHAAFPEIPFSGFYQDMIFQSYFSLVDGHSKVMVFTAFFLVILSCMGLFGLVHMNIISRLKDYSIMKVLGIGNFGLVKKVSKIFIWYLVVPILLAFPVSLFSTKLLFSILYTDHVPISMIYPILAALLLLVTAYISIAVLLFRLLKRSAIVSLKIE